MSVLNIIRQPSSLFRNDPVWARENIGKLEERAASGDELMRTDLGLGYMMLERYAEAKAVLETLWASNQGNTLAGFYLTQARQALGDPFGPSVEILEALNTFQPNTENFLQYLFDYNLQLGDMAKVRKYSRIYHPQLSGKIRAAFGIPESCPEWRPGKYTECLGIAWSGGMGDVFLFRRMLPKLKQIGAEAYRLIYDRKWKDNGMKEIISRQAGFERTPKNMTNWMPFTSLYELTFEGDLDKYARDWMPLLPDVALVERCELVKDGRPSVGFIATSSGKTGRHFKAERMIEAAPHVNWYDLGLDATKIPGVQNPNVKGWEQTAAVIANLDLVVGVDTSITNLSADMGKPTWVIATCLPDFRWGIPGVCRSWYPSARLFKSPNGYFDKAIEEVIAELGRMK